MYKLIDSHAHLEEINALGEAFNRARSGGVIGVIAVGSGITSNRIILELAQEYAGLVFPALGLHPWQVGQSDIEAELEFLDGHIDRAVALGEVGLDYSKRVRETAEKDLQKHVLGEVLKIAFKHGKPAIIHSRYAWQDAFELVEKAGVTAVFHWYTGTSSVLRRIVGGGYYLSANPAVEYHEEHRRAIKECDLGHLLLETDSPVTYHFGTPQAFQASPADVSRVAKGVAVLLNLGEDQVAEITTANAIRLFNLKGLLIE